MTDLNYRHLYFVSQQQKIQLTNEVLKLEHELTEYKRKEQQDADYKDLISDYFLMELLGELY